MPTKPFAKTPPKTAGVSLTRLAQTLFSKQLKFKRGESGMKFVLESAVPTAEAASKAWASVVIASASSAVPASSTFAGVSEPTPATNALSCLAELMDSAPGSRHAFRHLAAIEAGLQSGGNNNADGLFLFDLSAAHLKQALRQLDGLWMEPAPRPLSDLRAKMSDALAAQETRDLEAHPSRGSFNVLSSFLVDEKMQVSEGRATDFQQLTESWGNPTLAAIKR